MAKRSKRTKVMKRMKIAPVTRRKEEEEAEKGTHVENVHDDEIGG